MNYIAPELQELDLSNYMYEALVEADLAGQAGELPIGAVYVHRHIKSYYGGILREESIAIWMKYDPKNLAYILGRHY